MSEARDFKDHFSGHATRYAAHRPTYPARLFERLAELAPGRDLAWDAGTGNGQAALALAAHFAAVVATDASPEQVAAAPQHPKVTFRVGAEEGSGLAPGSADLVTVAQAAHWFDLERFWPEVRRVLRPGGLVAVWGYSRSVIDPAIDAAIERFEAEVVRAYWPPECGLLTGGYADLALPFARVALPPLAIEAELELAGLCAYVDTWSAVRRYAADRGADPVAALRAELAPLWGEGARRVAWPLTIHVGRVASSA